MRDLCLFGHYHSFHQTDQMPSWRTLLKRASPDRLAWIREQHLDVELVREYSESLHSDFGVDVNELCLEGGECLKQWETLDRLFQSFADFQLTRSSIVVTTGGGALSDVVGFAASIWKRGVAVVHIPTTTLSAIDAAWGGKTGCNWAGVKNQIGTFHQPLHVHVDSRWLATLSPRPFRAGLAEAAKHAMIADASHLAAMPAQPDAMASLKSSNQDWSAWLLASAKIKMSVVSRDENERGVRQTLNLGHTVGHAIESHFVTQSEPWLHGEAVALGLHFAIHESTQGSLSPEATSDHHDEEARFISEWLSKHVPLPIGDLPLAEELWPYMIADKKNAFGEVRDVAWRGAGSLVWPVVWKKDTFEATWSAFRRSWNNTFSIDES